MSEITSLAQLKQSTASRSGAPDGNIYFNPDGTLEIITAEELAQVDLGAGLVDNPLTNADGITMNLLYRFERQERRIDENLRELDVYIEGSFKFAGAYNFVNGRKLSMINVGGALTDDRQKIRSSGFIEYAAGGGGNTLIDRVYFGALGTGTVLEDSQISLQNIQDGAVAGLAFAGAANEVIQAFGSTSNGDVGAGDFDSTAFLALSVRTFGQVHDRKFASEANVNELSGFLGTFALSESPNAYHTDAGNPALEDVFGAAAIGPYDTMTFETVDAAENLPGLINSATDTSQSGSFTGVVRNPSGGSLASLVALMDALAMQDSDIDGHATSERNGAEAETLYTLDAQGNVVLRPGIYLEGVPVADRSKIRYTDDNGDPLVYETVSGGTIDVGSAAAGDANAWYHMFIQDGDAENDFNTLSAYTVNDSLGNPIKGLVGGLTQIPWDFAYSTNVQGGRTPNTDLVVVVEVEGNGGATFRKTIHTITSSASQTINCQPSAETNI